MADFGRAIELDPKDTLPLMARGELLLLQGKEPAARKDFDRAAKLAPADAGLSRRRGDAYDGAKMYEQAVAAYDEALKSAGEADRGYLVNARCMSAARLGRDLEKVLAGCRQGMKLSPSSKLGEAGEALSLLRLGRFDEAESAYSAILAKIPDSAGSYQARGLARLRKGEKAAGEADLKRAAQIDPGVQALYKSYGLAP
jgi:tetratricopeptide (TPR) repeat protein